MSVSSAGRKTAIANVLRPVPVGAVARRLERRRRPVLIVNVHSVPPSRAKELDQLLALLAGRFAFANPLALEELATDGAARPTILLTFDDGLANHAGVVSPLLDAHGVRAVFAVPAAFPDVPPAEQADWFVRHIYPQPTEVHPVAERRAMSWDELLVLARSGHRVCSHGFAHRVLDGHEEGALLDEEIVGSRAVLERRLPGVDVNGFCWPVRPAPVGSPADELVRATYDYALTGGSRAVATANDLHRLPRLNLEVSWPHHVVELQLLRASVMS